MSTQEDSTLPTGTKIFPLDKYFDFYEKSIEDIEAFWAKVAAENISWFKTWEKTLDWNPPFAKWFVGGKLNASYNCLDRHLPTKRNKVAYYWEGEKGEKRSLSYQDLFSEVNKFASALIDLGVSKDSKVTIYLPMIPELPIAMLACARLGAPFTVVFSGFSSQALSDRMNDSGSSLLITADGGFRRGKVIPLKSICDEALTTSSQVEKVIVYRRTGENIEMKQGRDVWWSDIVSGKGNEIVAPEQVDSSHTLYLLYSSGTTGKPKAIVHGTGGYITYHSQTCGFMGSPTEPSILRELKSCLPGGSSPYLIKPRKAVGLV